jgi:hypothetical protein
VSLMDLTPSVVYVNVPVFPPDVALGVIPGPPGDDNVVLLETSELVPPPGTLHGTIVLRDTSGLYQRPT